MPRRGNNGQRNWNQNNDRYNNSHNYQGKMKKFDCKNALIISQYARYESNFTYLTYHHHSRHIPHDIFFVRGFLITNNFTFLHVINLHN